MSALDDALYFVEDNNTIGSGVSVSAARLELARLRAAASEAEALRAERDELKDTLERLMTIHNERNATVAEQARKIEAARKVIERCSAYIGSIDHGENTKSYMMCDAWLAENAPAPTPEAGKEW